MERIKVMDTTNNEKLARIKAALEDVTENEQEEKQNENVLKEGKRTILKANYRADRQVG